MRATFVHVILHRLFLILLLFILWLYVLLDKCLVHIRCHSFLIFSFLFIFLSDLLALGIVNFTLRSISQVSPVNGAVHGLIRGHLLDPVHLEYGG